MNKIERVEILMVDPTRKVKRSDAIQAFVSQETPIVRIFADDGAIGIGYSYTIGTGGHAIVELLSRNLAPQLIGRDPDRIEEIWKSLLFLTHATAPERVTDGFCRTISTSSANWDFQFKEEMTICSGGAARGSLAVEKGWAAGRGCRKLQMPVGRGHSSD
jgi:L-alanine-DL-glutamate epimerase-like enolase superfamily enzyme